MDLFEKSIEEKIKLLGDGEYINCFLVEQRNLVPRNLVPRNLVPRNLVPRNLVPRNLQGNKSI